MPFVDVVLSDIQLESTTIPVGKYVFQLNPGAEYRTGKFSGCEELAVSATVAEGDSAGRVAFWAYPDPTVQSKNGKSQAWSAQALKKLEVSLGEDALPGEDPASFLNRVASNNAARFSGEIIENKYMKDGKEETTTKFAIFKVGPAA